MRTWWNALSRREQMLLGALSLLVLALAAWYGAWRPVAQFQRAAAARHEIALREQREVQTLLQRLKAARAEARPIQDRPVAEAVRQSLEAAGLTAARVEPGPDGLRVRIGSVPSSLLFPWLADLQSRHGVTPRHLMAVKEGQQLLGLDATFVREDR